ncbi:uncharacterized protein LOC763464 [Strongylocentrotus purpuratus]|uniref:Uncharacterized protein n=1 Tax=Strongylocentrotus purpuratus TaxID=7668 RepID=A0A7M7LIP6_STRPU|nr:uncharacterized protein LOC763464 [Strongylocentrotus purpuratus]|eukprot:XP_001199449.1 PREDICTED: uncharacterized protein LOC763464 [Strongylocentrotus purpuratus]
MAALHLLICLFSPLLFSVVSPSTLASTTIAPEDLVKDFRKELADLKDIVALLQNHIITTEDGSETGRQQHAQDVRDFVAKYLLRNRQSALSLTNSSVASSDDLISTLLTYYTNPPYGGAVYTHWGRDDCVNGSELVYTGMATGAYYSHTGGGVNYLCLPHEPIYSDIETSTHATRSLLYAAEFETSTAPALQSLHDQTPACAVCRAPPTRLTKLMIPGRNECPSSKWRLEYKGYLMSSLYTQTTRTDFVCMDEDAMGVPGTTGNQHGALFYMVEARCSAGGIQCGPYVNGYELTCAVCTI